MSDSIGVIALAIVLPIAAVLAVMWVREYRHLSHMIKQRRLDESR